MRKFYFPSAGSREWNFSLSEGNVRSVTYYPQILCPQFMSTHINTWYFNIFSTRNEILHFQEMKFCKIRRQNDLIISFLTLMQKNPFKNHWKGEIQRFLMVKNGSKRMNITNFVAQTKLFWSNIKCNFFDFSKVQRLRR